MFLVDSVDVERFPESKKELDGLLSDDSLATVPFLVLGNKIDIPQAASEDTLRHNLGLSGYTTGKGKAALAENVRPIEVFMCSVVKRMGYGEGFRWLSQARFRGGRTAEQGREGEGAGEGGQPARWCVPTKLVSASPHSTFARLAWGWAGGWGLGQ